MRGVLYFCGESFVRENRTYFSLWLGSPLYRPVSVAVATVVGAGPYLLLSMVVCLVYQLSFHVSFWDLCMLFILFALYFVMMRFALGCPRTVVGGGQPDTVAVVVAWYHINMYGV